MMNLELFKLLDVALCFLQKKGIPFRIKTVCSMVDTLGRTKGSMSLEMLQQLCAFVPTVLGIAYEPDLTLDSLLVRSVQEDPPFVLKSNNNVVQYLQVYWKDGFRGVSKKSISKRLREFQTQQADDATRSKLESVPLPQNPNEELLSSSSSGEQLRAQSLRERYKVTDDNSHLDGILQFLKDVPFYNDQLVHVEKYDSRPLVTGELVKPLNPLLEKVIREKFNVKQFFRHQAVAIDAARQGKDIIVSTATSSGKSMIFNVPIFNEMINGDQNGNTEEEEGEVETDKAPQRRIKALYIFPTKALAQDQLASARKLSKAIHDLGGPYISVDTFDGDTLTGDRDPIRLGADIIITNPDMLHVSILPFHDKWKAFLEGLQYVVVDEAHTYYGAFGSHVACVLKRLIRIASQYSNRDLQFFCCSATIGNPVSLFKTLVSTSRENYCYVGEDVDGSPCGRRYFGIWNPPMKEDVIAKTVAKRIEKKKVDEGKDAVSMWEQGKRKSAIYETALLLSALVRLGVKTMAFCRTRKLTELVLRYTKDELKVGYKGKIYDPKNCPLIKEFQTAHPHLEPLVAGYRGGYQLDERRDIEAQLFSGKLLAVTATCALELGIDVGSLDAVILLGYPGSAASLWQQVGRAGRSGKDALSIFVCFNGPVDQYFVHNPPLLFDRTRVEDAILDPQNKYVLKDHLSCALMEKPLVVSSSDREDLELFGGKDPANQKKVLLALQQMTKDGILQCTKEETNAGEQQLVYQTHPKLEKPYNNVNLRIIDPVSIELYHGEHLMDTIPYSRAFFELYQGAIYMHQGRSFLVTKLDVESYKAFAQPTNVSYYTAASDLTDVNVVSKFSSNVCIPKDVETVHVHCGAVEVVTSVYGYRKIWLKTGKHFEEHHFTLPPIQYETHAIWVDISTSIQAAMNDMDLSVKYGIHAANHVLCKLLPLYVMCHHQNLGTEHTDQYVKRFKPPRLMVFDRCPGGLGASESGFSHMRDLLHRCYELVSTCPCSHGCPACIIDLNCSEHNSAIDKTSCAMIFKMLIGNEKLANPGSQTPCSPKKETENSTPKRPRPSSCSSANQNNNDRNNNTPVKKRLQGLDKAWGMGRARLEQIQIARPWTAQQPNHTDF